MLQWFSTPCFLVTSQDPLSPLQSSLHYKSMGGEKTFLSIIKLQWLKTPEFIRNSELENSGDTGNKPKDKISNA